MTSAGGTFARIILFYRDFIFTMNFMLGAALATAGMFGYDVVSTVEYGHISCDTSTLGVR